MPMLSEVRARAVVRVVRSRSGTISPGDILLTPERNGVACTRWCTNDSSPGRQILAIILHGQLSPGSVITVGEGIEVEVLPGGLRFEGIDP